MAGYAGAAYPTALTRAATVFATVLTLAALLTSTLTPTPPVNPPARRAVGILSDSPATHLGVVPRLAELPRAIAAR